MFNSYLCEKIKAVIKRCNTDIAVIPGGLTSVIQPLDICLNKSFKDKFHQCWNEWMVCGNQSFTAAGNTRTASRVTVCEWIVKSWEDYN